MEEHTPGPWNNRGRAQAAIQLTLGAITGSKVVVLGPGRPVSLDQADL